MTFRTASQPRPARIRPVCPGCDCPNILVAGQWICPHDAIADTLMGSQVTIVNGPTATAPAFAIIDHRVALRLDYLAHHGYEPDELVGLYITAVSTFADGNDRCVDGSYTPRGVPVDFFHTPNYDILADDYTPIIIHIAIEAIEDCFNNPLER